MLKTLFALALVIAPFQGLQAATVIHVTGLAGSGKTTLGKEMAAKYGKTLSVFDTDDFSDKNAIELLENDKRFRELLLSRDSKDIDELNAKIDAKNYVDLTKWLELSRSQGKDLLIVGLSFGGKADPGKVANHKFSIRLAPEELYKQQTLRTLDSIESHKNDIRLLIASGKDIDIYPQIASWKFGIRNTLFPFFSDFKEQLASWEAEKTQEGYAILSRDEIKRRIQDIVTSSLPAKKVTSPAR